MFWSAPLNEVKYRTATQYRATDLRSILKAQRQKLAVSFEGTKRGNGKCSCKKDMSMSGTLAAMFGTQNYSKIMK